MARKRFNRSAVCSSYHYVESKIHHREYLEENHEIFEREVKQTILAKTTYVMCFGHRVVISEIEAKRLEKTSIKVYHG